MDSLDLTLHADIALAYRPCCRSHRLKVRELGRSRRLVPGQSRSSGRSGLDAGQ